MSLVMRTIENREDVNILVNAFYAKIRKDNLLGPIFNDHIAEEKWPEHLDKLTDFWESNLFGLTKFKGNPTQKHVNVDRNLNHSISPSHFEQWLILWHETIDEMYSSDLAIKAKNTAANIASAQFMMIQRNRSKGI
jgi:hemoglobin